MSEILQPTHNIVVIIPENERNNTIAFDFRNFFAPELTEPDKFDYFAFLKNLEEKYEKELGRKLKNSEKVAFKRKIRRDFTAWDIDNYILILDKEKVDHRFADMTNKEILYVFENGFAKIKELDYFMDLLFQNQRGKLKDRNRDANIADMIRRTSDYTAYSLPKNGEISIVYPVWDASEQAVLYYEQKEEKEDGTIEYRTAYRYLGINPGSKQSRKPDPDREF